MVINFKEEKKLLKARNRKLSMILVLAMLMTMFAGLGTASAAGVTYEALTVPTVNSSSTSLGKILITIDDTRALPVSTAGYEYLTISFPSGITLKDAYYPVSVASDVYVVNALSGGASPNPLGEAIRSSSNTLELFVAKAPGYVRTKDFNESILLDLSGAGLTGTGTVAIQGVSGDIMATFAGPDLFNMAQVKIAQAKSQGTTTSMAKSVKVFGDAGGEIDSFIIMEDIPGTLKSYEEIKLRLPSGFSWDSAAANVYARGQWGLTAKTGNTTAGGDWDFRVDSDKRNAYLTLKDAAAAGSDLTNTASTAGRVVIGSAPLFLKVKVDDSAKFGDVVVNVSSDLGNVTEQDILVATYGEYKVNVTEDTKKEIVSGKTTQKVGEFLIEEQIPNSLVAGRTVILELPAGVKWAKNPRVDAEKGVLLLSNTSGAINWSAVSGSKDRAIKTTIATGLTRDKASKMRFKEAEVYVEPGFSGPIEVTISGSAGAEGSVVIAEVAKAVDITVEKATDVIIGEQNQKAPDILITENFKGAVMDSTYHKNIIVGLDSGVSFYKTPKVTVEEGNLEIDSTKIVNGQLKLVVKYSSTKPSVIRISDVALTLDRTVPEGPVEATLIKSIGAESSENGSSALDESFRINGAAVGTGTFSETSAGSVVIANTVTPAPTEGTAGATAGQFKITSNIYYVGGVAKVMDVAPYIKDSRTYVPMRYLGEILGAEVVWDDAARTVTLTRGDDVVVFTIGSASYTVNGEAKTADVAPEIVNSRTMLPARFVAEAFGAVVGWDPGTQTVLISK